MIRVTALAVLFTAASTFAQTPPAKPPQKAAPTAAVPAALKPLQGTWILTTPDGQPMAPNGGLTITFTGNAYEQSVSGAVNEHGTIKVDATKKPMWIDLMIKDGADAGKTQVGLIEITAGVMKGALGPAGSTTRPTSLTPAQGVISFVGKKK